MSNQEEPILVVDDEEMVRAIISEKLTLSGFSCTPASSTSDALQKLDQSPFSLALVDIRMPGASGMELLREIRISYPDTVVIIVTGVSDAATAIEAMRLGARDYIVKPLNLEALLLSVERALETRRIIKENREYRLHLEEKVREQTKKVRELFLGALRPIAQALENRDPYWRRHSQTAAEVAASLAREMSLPQEVVEKVRLGLQLHDIGMIGVSEKVLHKPGPLTEEEHNHMMAHTTLGGELLSPIVEDQDVMAVIKHHHERWDGNGLPDRLKGPEIPLSARIASLADAYVAMVSPRPHRQPLSQEKAREEIMKASGTLFDPHIVSAFMRLPADSLVRTVGDISESPAMA